MDKRNVVLQFEGKTHDIDITDITVEILKLHIYSITNIPPQNQKILGLVKNAILKDDTQLSSLDIKIGQRIMVLGQKEDQSVTTTPTITPSDSTTTTTNTPIQSNNVKIENKEEEGEIFEPSIWTQECTRIYVGKQDVLQPRFIASNGLIVCYACANTCCDPSTSKLAPLASPFYCHCSESQGPSSNHECLFEPRIDKLIANQQSLKSMKDQMTTNVRSLLAAEMAKKQQQQGFFNNNNINPTKEQEERIISIIESNYKSVMVYEQKDLQQRALALVPNTILFNRKGVPLEKGPEQMRELLSWFKQSFFKWVDQPNCDYCNGPTKLIGMTQPSMNEQLYKAGRCELYECSNRHQTRFPRYNDPSKLLETRRGRCGEWANTFTLFCRALGYRSRYIYDFTDHVWTEVWIEQENRWIHCDSCEPLYDAPLTYEAGWGKKLSYVFGFEVDGCFDVSRRYTLAYNQMLGRRNIVPEQWLSEYFDKVNGRIRDRIKDVELKNHLDKRKEIENSELDSSQSRSVRGDDLMPRASGSEEWRSQRGEMGQSSNATPEKSTKPTIQQPSLTMNKETVKLIGNARWDVSNALQLTQRLNDQCGAFWSSNAIDVSRDWAIEIKFKIDGQGADGMALVIQNHQHDIIGKRGDGLGYDGIENSLAVEFDMYESKSSCGDPNGNHISIHCNGDRKNSSHHRYSLACSSPVGNRSMNDGSIHTAVITYGQKKMSVWFDEYFIISNVSIDLSKQLDLQENTKAWIGMTGATGGVSQCHNILSFQFGYL